MCNLIYDIPLTSHIGCTFIDFSQKSIESTALLCVCLETGGRSVQHSQSAIHCQTWMYHRVGCHHKSGQAFCFVPLIQGGFKYTECNLLLFTLTQCGTNTQLLHVFQEDFILGYKPQDEEVHMPAFPSGEGVAHNLKLCLSLLSEDNNKMLLYPDYQPAPFSEKFFLVVIEKDLNRNSVLQMWHLHLKSVQACVGNGHFLCFT